MNVPESLLQFVWQHRLFNQTSLKSYHGESVLVIHPGELNVDAGPDFLFAKIKIGDAVWVGHVEVHTEGRLWYTHRHDVDAAYSNVILHVIWDRYTEVRLDAGAIVPTVLLRDYVSASLLDTYRHMQESMHWIPCSEMLNEVPDLVFANTYRRVLVERMEEKYAYVRSLLADCRQDWEVVTMILLFRSVGMRANKEVFTDFARCVSPKLIRKYATAPIKIEALLFGQSGLLTGSCDDAYTTLLQEEYHYLAQLHGLESLKPEQWRFLRMRPANFPGRRIAQLSAILIQLPYLFSFITQLRQIGHLQEIFRHVMMNAYWGSHYHFGKKGAERALSLSTNLVDHLTINVVVVVMYAYGRYLQQEDYIALALEMLEETKAENNQIVRKYTDHRFPVHSAADSQALLLLKSRYCEKKCCLQCGVGYAVLKRGLAVKP